VEPVEQGARVERVTRSEADQQEDEGAVEEQEQAGVRREEMRRLSYSL
jgi:hypothetical protein